MEIEMEKWEKERWISKRLVYTLLALACAFGIGVVISYLGTQNPIQNKVLERSISTSTEVAIPLDTNPELYDCTELERLSGEKLTFCKMKGERERISGKSYVMGYYMTASDTIMIDKSLEMCGIFHELFHAVDLGRGQQYRTGEEDRAYDFQKLCWQLQDKGFLK